MRKIVTKNWWLPALVAGWALVTPAAAQQEALFRNVGELVNPAPINATRVENLGTITVGVGGASAPFDFENTLEFFNFFSGVVDVGDEGIRFDYLDLVLNPTGLRLPMAEFNNTGTIRTTGPLLVNATNINVTSQGLLSTDQDGILRIEGQNVNLLNGRLKAGMGTGDFPNSEGAIFRNIPFYINPRNIRDDAWGVSGTAANGAGNLSLPSTASNPGFRSGYLMEAPGPLNTTFLLSKFLFLDGFDFYMNNRYRRINDNTVRATVQMVVIETNIADKADVQVNFLSSTNSNNFLPRDVIVQFLVNDRDPVTGQSFVRSIELVDELASRTLPDVGGLTASPVIFEDTAVSGRFRPDAHIIIRDSLSFLSTSEPAQPYDPSFIFTTSATVNGRYETNLVAHEYAASDFTISPVNFTGAGFGSDDGTGRGSQADDSAGRVEIAADQLNLQLAAIRADNMIDIAATNITSMAGATFDSPNVKLDLLSPSGQVVISNNFGGAVERLNGQVEVWSGVWRIDQFITNQVPANYDPIREVLEGDGINWSGTNTVEYLYQLIVIDHNVVTNMDVQFSKFSAQAESLVLADPIVLNDEFFFGGRDLTLGTNIQLTGLRTVLNTNNLSTNVYNFTNNGAFFVPELANLGFDRAEPYSNIVNRGTFQVGEAIITPIIDFFTGTTNGFFTNILGSGSALFRADYFENTNAIAAFGGSVFVEAATNRLKGGSISAGNAIQLSGGDLVATNSFLSSGGVLLFDVDQRLTDGDITNEWTTGGGFQMLTRPRKGDLLSSSLRSASAANTTALMSWAGDDRGDDPAGYANNAAVARLVLDGQTNSGFFFTGVGAGSAMYVDTLELEDHATNFNSISVAPNFTLYFANLVDGDGMPLPADKFTNAHSGRIVWVSPATRAGPMMTVPLSLGSSTNLTTQAFRSLAPALGDYDGDGILNEEDSMPLSGFTVNSVTRVDISGQPHTKIVWQSLPGITYFVEYRDSLEPGPWQVLSVRVSIAAGDMAEFDPVPDEGMRFYRVRYER